MRAGLDAEWRGLEREAGLLLAHLRIEREDCGAGAVHRDFDLLASDRVAEQEPERLGKEVETEDVLTVSREDVLHRNTAARAWRRAFNARHLRCRLRQLEGGLRRRAFRIPDRQHGDAAGRSQVALHQGWREGLHISDVVETVADRVRRQERGDVDIDTKQVFDFARVLRPIQALERSPAGIRVRRRERIHARFERAHQLRQHRRRRALRAARRHQAGAQLVDHFLGDVTMVRRLPGIPSRERQPASLATFAVAGDAILRDQLGLGRRRDRGGVRRYWSGPLGFGGGLSSGKR